MTTQTYTRDYLRALPVQTRKQLLKNTIEPFIRQILAAARCGQTSIMINPFYDPSGMGAQSYRGIGQPIPTVDDIREALLLEFPDCTIVYEEKWVQLSPAKQELKKGLVVDWS